MKLLAEGVITISQPPSPSPDSTPLLSTLVQSGAALVAIIAGLLVARLVALVGERVALERRIKELEEIKVQRQAELDSLRHTRLDEDAEDFIASVFDSYFEDPDKPFEEFYRELDDDSRTADELRPYFERFAHRVRQLFDQLDCAALIEEEKPSDWYEKRPTLVHQLSESEDRRIADELLKIVEAGWAEREHQLMPRSLWSPPFPIGSIIATDSAFSAARYTVESAYQRDLRRNETSAESALKEVELELGHARQALSIVSRPQGLVTALLVLAGVALAGMVLPLLQMTFGQPSLSVTMRAVYVGLFIASLVIFFIYLAFEMRRIMRLPSDREMQRPMSSD